MENFNFIKDLFISGGEKLRLKGSDHLFNVGDKPEYVFLIKKGMMVIKNPDTSQKFKATANTFLGIKEVIMEEEHTSMATASSETEVLSIPKQKFLSYIFNNAEVRSFFISYMSKELPVYEQAFE